MALCLRHRFVFTWRKVRDPFFGFIAVLFAQLLLGGCTHSHFSSSPRSLDFHFLSAFSRAYALVADAAAAAGDGAAAATLVELQESVDEELGLHRGFAASWDVVLDGASSSPLLPRASAATTAYTSFLLDTADKASSSSSHSLAGIARALAAMVPCCRLYGWLGVKIKQQEEKAEEEKRADTDTPEAKKNPFASWIETYSSCEYHAATVKLEGLLDRLAEGLSAEELGECVLFLVASFFIFFAFQERVFFPSQHRNKRCARRLVLPLPLPAREKAAAAAVASAHR